MICPIIDHKNKIRKMKETKDLQWVKNKRLIDGFYYAYLHPEEVGNRSKGWMMMAFDKVLP